MVVIMQILHLLSLLPFVITAPLQRTQPLPLLVPSDTESVIANKYIVKLKNDLSFASFDDELAILTDGAEFVFNDVFRGFAGTLDAETLDRLRYHPDVEFIEQDAIVKAAAYVQQPNSPWGLARISSRTKGKTTYVYDDSAGLGTCSYILDTGIEASHPDFGGRAFQIATFVGGTTDGNGHGTHVAGIVGSTTHGVAKKTTLLGIKVLNDGGSGTISGIIAGMNHVNTDSATRSCPRGVFVNLSLSGTFSTAMNSAAASLVNSGKFVAAAAGNNAAPASNYSPGGEPTVCTAGSSDINDVVASSSNFGPAIDIFAPGRLIVSTWLGGTTQTLSGSSLSAPHICGLAAYLSTLENTANPGNLCARIQQLATINALTGVPAGTVNFLAFNGNPAG